MSGMKLGKVICISALVSVLILTGAMVVFAQEPYRIGAVMGLTGYIANAAIPGKRICEMQVEEINRSGAINGHPLELIIDDTESSDSKGLLAIKKQVIKDKVSAVVSNSGTGLVLAAMSFYEEQGIPAIANVGATIVAKPVKKWIFKTPALTTDAVERVCEYMQKHGIRKIAILTMATSFGDEGRTEWERLAAQYGIQIVANERFDPKDSEMSAQLTRIRSTDAQAVQVWSIGPHPAMIAKQRVQLGLKIPLFQCHGVGDADYLRLAGEAAEGSIMPTSGVTVVADQLPESHPQKAMAMKWNARYQEQYKEFAPPMAGYAFDALQMIVNAMKKVGPDRAKLRDEIERTKGYVGLTGVFTFSPTDHSGVTKKDLVMIKVENGKYVYLKE